MKRFNKIVPGDIITFEYGPGDVLEILVDKIEFDDRVRVIVGRDSQDNIIWDLFIKDYSDFLYIEDAI